MQYINKQSFLLAYITLRTYMALILTAVHAIFLLGENLGFFFSKHPPKILQISNKRNTPKLIIEVRRSLATLTINFHGSPLRQ